MHVCMYVPRTHGAGLAIPATCVYIFADNRACRFPRSFYRRTFTSAISLKKRISGTFLQKRYASISLDVGGPWEKIPFSSYGGIFENHVFVVFLKNKSLGHRPAFGVKREIIANRFLIKLSIAIALKKVKKT